MEKKTYAGLLSEHSWGDADELLFLSSAKDPLCQELEWINRKLITARYWITDRQVSKEEAQKEFLKMITGSANVDFGSHYSETTGYLWTDEELNIGGHDLMRELHSYVGKWLILEIEAV